MSVLIKGMEMPKDGCRGCQLVNRKWMGDVCPILKREVTGNVERGGFQTDCPLVPVPPHGRLIDGDASIDVAEGHVSRGQTTIAKFLLNHIEGLIPRVVIPAEEDE